MLAGKELTGSISFPDRLITSIPKSLTYYSRGLNKNAFRLHASLLRIMKRYTKHFNHSLIKLSNSPYKQGKKMSFQWEVGVMKAPSGVCLDLQTHKYR